jgi:hypothetical protein
VRAVDPLLASELDRLLPLIVPVPHAEDGEVAYSARADSPLDDLEAVDIELARVRLTSWKRESGCS